jgi:hypothetical protein
VPSLPKPKPTPLQRRCARKACGVVFTKKRDAQRYCSKQCRDLDAMRRLRLRSANMAELEKAAELENGSPVSPYREALTAGLQPIDLTDVSEAGLDTYIRAFRRPVINVSGRSVGPQLLARIIRTEAPRPAAARKVASAVPVMMDTEEARCEPQH